MKIEFTPAAISQLASISAYLREHNPSAAVRVADAIQASANLLAKAPFLGRKQDEAGVRKKVVGSTRYLLFYTVLDDDDIVRIIAVVHGAQRNRFRDA